MKRALHFSLLVVFAMSLNASASSRGIDPVFESHVCRVYNAQAPKKGEALNQGTFLGQVYGATPERATYEGAKGSHLSAEGFDNLKDNLRSVRKGILFPEIDRQLDQQNNEPYFLLTYKSKDLYIVLEGPLCEKLLNPWDGSLRALNNMIAISLMGYDPAEGT